MQHRGGLTPPPAGRRRRATKPSSTTQHRLKKVYLHPTPLQRSWHTRTSRFALHIAQLADLGQQPGHCHVGLDGQPPPRCGLYYQSEQACRQSLAMATCGAYRARDLDECGPCGCEVGGVTPTSAAVGASVWSRMRASLTPQDRR